MKHIFVYKKKYFKDMNTHVYYTQYLCYSDMTVPLTNKQNHGNHYSFNTNRLTEHGPAPDRRADRKVERSGLVKLHRLASSFIIILG